MKGGMAVMAIKDPLISPATPPITRPHSIGTAKGMPVRAGNTARA